MFRIGDKVRITGLSRDLTGTISKAQHAMYTFDTIDDGEPVNLKMPFSIKDERLDEIRVMSFWNANVKAA